MSLFDSGIRPAVDAWLLEESKKVRSYGEYWSASSAGYCMRRNIFERLKVPHSVPEDARKQRVFTAGHLFHDWIQGITREAGLSIAQEVELQDEELMIRGHIDDLVPVNGVEQISPSHEAYKQLKGVHDNKVEPLIATKHLILYDYKTVNSRSFMWAKKNGNAMSFYHSQQLATYALMLKKAAKAELKKRGVI